MQPQNSNGYDSGESRNSGSLDDAVVQDYASNVTQAYRLESLEEPLEVHSAQAPTSGVLQPARRSMRFGSFFSRRKAMIVSTLITALVLLLTLVSMAFLVRQGPEDKQNAHTVTQQDVKIDNPVSSTIPDELQGAQQSLLVSGDIITRGSLKISDGGYVTVIRVQNPTANQTVTLPGTSGTICLDTNNCGYGSQGDVTALQGQQGVLQSQIDELNGLINSLGQITIPPAGVTQLNGQTGSVNIQGSVNRIAVSTSGGVVTITTPQDLDSNANVQFGNLSLSASGQIRANTLVQTSAGNSVNISAGNDMITFVAGGRVFQLPTTGGATQTICTTGATCASGSGTAVILSPGTAQVDGTADSSIFINDTGGGNLVHLQSGGVDRFTIGNTGDTTVGGSLTVAGLGNGFVRSSGGTLGVVTAIDLATDVTGTLPISNGGTGSSTAGGARTNLGAAASGANADITSTAALNTITPSSALTIGTPAQQFTLQGASNSSISAGSGANITTLAFASPTGSNTITFPALTGTVCVSTGNCAAAGTAGGDLTGNYPNPTIARLQGANLNITGSSNGQILVYNGTNSRWENASVSGDITLSGTGVATIANNAITTGKIADGNVINAKLQNSSLTVTAGNGLLNGGNVSLGSSIALNIGQGDGITVSADDIAVDNTVCRTTGNCAGVGGNGDISGSGSANRLVMFNGTKTIASSTLLQSAGSLTLDSGNNFVLTSGNLMLSNGNVDVTGGGNFTGTVSGADAVQNDEFVTLSQLNAAIGGVGGGVDSLNTLAGDLSLQGTAGQITISDNGSDTITLSLNSAVTLQGNTFNGINQLVRLGASGELPVLNAANLTNLNASNLASGTVPSARVSGSYTGITGVGTVTTGTWNGSAIADAYLQDNITISNLGSVDWTALNNYPGACPAGQAITALGDTVTCQVFAAGSGSGNYIQNTTSNQNSANFNIQSVATGSVTAKFRLIGGQTADVIQVRDSADTTTLFSVSASGAVIASSFTGDGSGLTNLNASNIASGTLNTARIADGSLGNAKLQNSSLTVSAGGGLINGGNIALGGSATLNIGQGDGITVNADDIAVDNTVCRTTGNCAGVGGTGDITGGGTANRIALFSANKTIVDSYLLQSAGALTLDNGADLVLAGGDINVTGGGSFTGTVSGANAVNANEFVTKSQLDAAVGGVGGGVSSLNTLAGALSLQGTAGQVTVTDNGSNTITVALDANVTLQGNTFNGPDQLVKLNNTGALPVLDGSNLTNVNAALLQGQNGAYYLDLGNATGTLNIARIADASITNAKLVNDSITVTAGNGLTGGGTTALGGTNTLNIGAGDGITVNANDIAVDATVARLNANANFTAGLQQGGNDVCTTAGNCAGVGGVGDITGSGTSGRLALFDAAKNITNSSLLQSAGTLTLDTGTNFVLTAGNLTLSAGDINVTGNGSFGGTVTATDFTGSGANLTNLNATQLTSGTVASARISGSYTGITGVGTVTVGTWNGTAISDAYIQDNITISGTGTVDWAALSNYPAACPAGSAITQLGDTVTCQAFATGGDGGVTTIGAIDSQTKSANGAVISGVNLYLQTADASNPGLVSTGSQIFAGNKTFNGSVTLAANQTLTFTGGTTANRPVGTEGMVYYDTDTDRLLTYSNGKWQADRSEAILVAASNSSQADKDAADYVADGNTGAAADGDQVEINQALAAGAGKKVVLLAGTYVADATILMPNDTVLTGIGSGTVIELADIDATDNLIENSDTSTGVGVVIRDMAINGRKDLNTAGTQHGIVINGMGDSTTREGATIERLVARNFRDDALRFSNSFHSSVTDSSFINNSVSGVDILGASSYITVSGNTAHDNNYGFSINGSLYNVLDNNVAYNNNTAGIYLIGSANSNTITGNVSRGNTTNAILIVNSSNNVITGSSIRGNTTYGIHLSGSNNNNITNNMIYDVGGATTNNAIYLEASSSSNGIGYNNISDTSATTDNFAINVSDAGSSTNQLTSNVLISGSINDLGTGTIYGGQINGSGNYVIQPAGTVELMKDTNVTGNFNATGSADFNGSLTVGNANQFVISNLGVVTSGTWQGTAITDTYVADTLTVNSSSTVDWQALNNYPAACGTGQAITQLGDSVTCTTFAAGSGSGNYIQNQNASSQTTANFWISGTGRADTALQAPTFDTATAAVLTLGGNATSISVVDDVTVAAGKSLTITGGNTGSRPVGTEGMLYYDTDTKQLLVYSNGKWQADRSTATKIIAPSNASDAAKASADVVLSGTADQTLINSALTAAAGGKVYILKGTVTVTGSISIPNNTTLSGEGANTIVTIPNNYNSAITVIRNTDTSTGTGVVLRDLTVDGNKANQVTPLSNTGVSLNAGSGTGASALKGSTIINVAANNFLDYGISLSGSYSTVKDSFARSNDKAGFIFDGAYNTFERNSAQANTLYGFFTGSPLANSVLDGNNANGSGQGFSFAGTTDSTITNNTATSNTNRGFAFTTNSNNNTISGNTSTINTNSNYYFNTSSGNTVTANTSTGSQAGFSVTTGSTSNTFSGNVATIAATGFSLSSSSRNAITGNTVYGNTSTGITLNGSSNTVVSANRLYDNGGAAANNAILISGSDANTITSNNISDTSATTTNYSIDIFDAASDNNYLADNNLGTGTIHDLGTGTIYGGQVSSSGNYVIQPAGTIELMKNTNVTGTLNITGDVDTNGSLTVGNANQFVISNTGVVTSGTWNGTAIIDAYVADNITVSSAGTVDWQALSNYPAACPAGQAVTQLGDSITCTAFAAGTGSGNYIQNQNAGQQATSNFWISGTGRADTSFTTPLLDTATATALNVGTTNATQINLNQNVVVAAGKGLTITGGNTGSRPASPTEGMIYFDTTTKKLLTYSNGKWQADRSDAVFVAASNSSQADKDAADFVADGDTVATGDGDQVQINAALAVTNGKVYLLPGTYTVDDSINVNGRTLEGAGRATIIELSDIDAYADMLLLNTNRSVIRNLYVDGRSDLNSSGNQYGARANDSDSIIENVYFTRIRTQAITVTSGEHNTIINGNTFKYNGTAINLGGSHVMVSDNIINENDIGVIVNSTNSTITGNFIHGNAVYGINIVNANNLISVNSIGFSGGVTDNNGIYVDSASADRNTITGNTITDGFCVTTCYAININHTGAEENYLADNTFDLGDTIQDLGTGTIYGGQVNGSGNYVIQPAGTVELMKDTNVTGTLNVSGDLDTNGSLTVGNANQFVISNTGIVTSGTWQAGTIGLLYGGTNNTSYTTNGIVYSNGTSLVSTGAGTNGQCLIATTGSAPTWGTCTVASLQSVYNASSPATILMTDNKDFTINTGDTTTDSSIIFNLSCATCSANGGRFAVQDAGTDVFTVNPNGDILIGSSTNGVIFTNGFKLEARGSARNTKAIRLSAEYPSAVITPDLTNNLGTMTSDYDGTNRMNYYNWTTTQGTNQDYDIVVQVPLPSDFSAWASNPLSISTYTSDTTNGLITLEARDSSNAVICNYVGVTPGSTGTWATNNTACTLSTGTYTAGDYITLRIKLQAPNAGNTRVGNIVLNYLSKF